MTPERKAQIRLWAENPCGNGMAPTVVDLLDALDAAEKQRDDADTARVQALAAMVDIVRAKERAAAFRGAESGASAADDLLRAIDARFGHTTSVDWETIAAVLADARKSNPGPDPLRDPSEEEVEPIAWALYRAKTPWNGEDDLDIWPNDGGAAKRTAIAEARSLVAAFLAERRE